MEKIISPFASPPGDVFNEREAASYLHQKPRTLREWRNRLGLPFLKITGKTILYRKCDIDGWLARRRVAITA